MTTSAPHRELSLREVDPTAPAPPSLAARATRTLGWTALTSGTVTAATLFGMALSIVCAVGVLFVGVLALALIATAAVLIAAALVVLGVVCVGLAVGALAVAAVAGAVWLVVAFVRLTIGAGRAILGMLQRAKPMHHADA